MTTERLLRKASQAIGAAAGTGTLAAFLVLAPGVARAQYAVSDSQLQAGVTSALQSDAKLGGASIGATAAQGVVTLTGTVPDETARTEAEQVAAGVRGVKSIQDNINTMDGPAAPAPGGQQNAPPTNEQQSAPANNTANTAKAMPPPPAAAAGTAASGMPPPPPADQSATSSQQPYSQNGSGAGAQNGYPRANGENAGQYPYPGPGYPAESAENGGYGPRGNAHPPRSTFGVSPQQQDASGPVSIPAGTLLSVRTSQPLSTNALQGGEYFQVTAAADVYANGVVAIPRGAVMTGMVVESKNAGRYGGSPKLDLRLTSIQLGSTTYPVASEVWSSQGPSKTGRTVGNAAGGAVIGALIGAIAGGGVGAGVGAIAGGTGGALISGATHGPRLDLPPEALLQFHLAAPLTVQPVRLEEAERLASSVPEQPILRRRPAYVAAPYPYAYPYPYMARPYPYPYGYYYPRYW